MKYFYFFAVSFLIISCQQETEKETDTLFRKVSEAESGIDFANTLEFDKDFNIFTYRNFYNGGGVGLGDFNNDGLLDIYFTANQKKNKLYLNEGGMKFRDISRSAGVEGNKAWSTGVSLVDINGDGLLDIYVCNSGDIAGDSKENELFINKGDLTFRESAAEYGLADPGFSTHAAFFDYDKDGDLDMYLLNNSYQAIGSFDLRRNERPKRDPVGGDKLFRNDNGKFLDVSDAAGIYGSIIGFGLGVTVGDIDGDHWQDIYVSNDFFERDYLYLNNQDGTFREVLEDQIRSLSAASMGADLSDINNDSRPDIFVTDMLPEPDERVKTVTTFENWDKYQYNLQNGYYHQFTRNMLQLNNGDNTFSEIGRLAGVEATDWSWGALIFDFQNDGLKDIFIANGIYQDLTDQDFLHYVKQEEVVKKLVSGSGVDYKSLIDLIPSRPIANYAYLNQGNLQFVNRSQEFGLGEPGFSNGSAYGDLDNDGDLDLIVNNVNRPSWVFENQTDGLYPENNYLRFELTGQGQNSGAFGTRIEVFLANTTLYLENMPIRGFESTVDSRPLFGLGLAKVADSVKIYWAGGAIQTLTNVEANQTLALKEPEENVSTLPKKLSRETIFQPVPGSSFVHQESKWVDFDKDRLVYHMRSTEGPCLCTGDVNNDGLEDYYIGGAAGQAGALFMQKSSGVFEKMPTSFTGNEVEYEDVDCAFFDADGDGFQDLYVASGSSEFSDLSSALGDRLYLNLKGNGFAKQNKIYPNGRYENTSSVVPGDVDGDGDLDLFVGIRMVPGYYGVPASSYLLINDGRGNFETDMELSAAFQDVGMVTDASWQDMDGDGDADLIAVGEWMPMMYFSNRGGNLVRDSLPNLPETAGWWNTIEVADFNNDGRPDLAVGNHGSNSRFQASQTQPVTMYVNDFDQNGTIEQIVTQYNGDKAYPMVLRHDLIMQLPHLKKKYLEWGDYKNQEMTDVFPPEALARSKKYEVTELETVVYLSGPGCYTRASLPIEAQFSVTYALEAMDVNRDGNMDLLVGGNLNDTKPEVGRYDANYGLVLLGDGKGGFSAMKAAESGLYLNGQTRGIKVIETQAGPKIIVANNNEAMQIFTEKSKK
ncbi:VCBS repeat-containing protein [Marinoscillum sp.]|uniref:VCBS repeat-containing protein n=1 Tax=Marinoscillum sp. TaxID=2024838 RepID=UPI003BAC28F4